MTARRGDDPARPCASEANSPHHRALPPGGLTRQPTPGRHEKLIQTRPATALVLPRWKSRIPDYQRRGSNLVLIKPAGST